jgi:hypothetical protein
VYLIASDIIRVLTRYLNTRINNKAYFSNSCVPSGKALPLNFGQFIDHQFEYWFSKTLNCKNGNKSQHCAQYTDGSAILCIENRVYSSKLEVLFLFQQILEIELTIFFDGQRDTKLTLDF